jgi:hypothetical protein
LLLELIPERFGYNPIQIKYILPLSGIPLIRIRMQEFPEVEQTWYADDAGAGAKFDSIRSDDIGKRARKKNTITRKIE